MKLGLLSLLVCSAAAWGEQTLFDASPEHLWNRLHRHFHTRTTLSGKLYDHESLEPLFVRRSKFLTSGESHTAALALLDEFLKSKGEDLVKDPVQRAVLQRDLWAVFSTTADPLLERQSERRELQKRLAQVMRRIALSEEEIARLPNSLAAAMKAGNYAKEFDSSHPERPFLPHDLAAPDGPWVVLRNRHRKDQIVAPSHVDGTGGRFAFFILLRLPEGRAATLAYLKSLENVRRGKDAMPQIPQGTMVALLRRTMLVDRSGTLRLSPVTENVQLRVYKDLAAPNMVEFSLKRRELFAGRGGGLVATGPDETNQFDLGLLGVVPHGATDPLEGKFIPVNSQLTPVVMKTCIVCHAGPGIFGLQSRVIEGFETPPLAAGNLADQVESHLRHTSQTYGWGLLQGLWEISAPAAR